MLTNALSGNLQNEALQATVNAFPSEKGSEAWPWRRMCTIQAAHTPANSSCIM